MSKAGKTRADTLLLRLGLCESRAKAQALIMAGHVRIGSDHVVTKPGRMFPDDTPLEVVAPSPYVSRGALKLLPALDLYHPDLRGVIALDVGASTGGFTQVLLERGVARVFAVDSGRGQLHLKLRSDPRVVCLERTNARYLDRDIIPDPVGVLVADVSFISLRKILPACSRLVRPEAWAFTLVKPQFEARREEVSRGGVVRDAAIRERCVNEVCTFAEERLGWRTVGVVPSPLHGPKGNRESVAVFRASPAVPG